MWNLPPPPGFQGLRDDLPLSVYVRHLPHWRQPGATYFVTFRLADSLPEQKVAELAAYRREWEERHRNRRGNAELEELAQFLARRLEYWLDQGFGSCLLREPEHAALVVEAMHHFDGQRYELGAYVVMPNHVHAILRPTLCEEFPLEDLIGSWKQYSANRINRLRSRTSDLWLEECYDRILRDGEHLFRSLQYIGSNPNKVNLAFDVPLWIRPEWKALGWTLA